MTLEDLGYHTGLENHRQEQHLEAFGVGRIISEHRERYTVKTEKDEFEAEVVGNLRFTARNRLEFPAVGDWVAISEYDDNKVLIHAIFPRNAVIERQAVGAYGEKQIIATNIDFAFIVQAVDRDFNINRIERYLTICYASGVKPIIIFSKIDLISESRLKEMLNMVKERIKQVPMVAISNETKTGYDELFKYLEKGKTYCLLGSSGAGKSTLINRIADKSLLKTAAISSSTQKGKHTTTHRELIVLDQGAIFIDNPGMREIGITEGTDGLETTFDTILGLSQKCRFKDCTHMHEKGCAVIAAVEKGEIDMASYENYLRMERERQHFDSSLAERKKKDKEFGKMLKNYKNNTSKDNLQN